MSVIPKNRRLKLKDCTLSLDKEKKEVSFLIPEQDKRPEEFGTLEITSVAEDCQNSWEAGDKVVFPSHMLETINVDNEEIKLILENYVVCVVTN
jgi:co-chaperonin GroES (HSP10)